METSDELIARSRASRLRSEHNIAKLEATVQDLQQTIADTARLQVLLMDAVAKSVEDRRLRQFPKTSTHFRDQLEARLTDEILEDKVGFKVGSQGTKIERARAIYNNMKGMSRKAVIQVFVNDLGMSYPGASTYYQQVKTLDAKATAA